MNDSKCAPYLLGMNINTLLLENIRVVKQAPGERNYHIFYILLNGLTAEEKSRLCLTKDASQVIPYFQFTSVLSFWFEDLKDFHWPPFPIQVVEVS